MDEFQWYTSADLSAWLPALISDARFTALDEKEKKDYINAGLKM
jgi:hypothetical protein